MISPIVLAGRIIGLYQATIFVYALLSWVPGAASGPIAPLYRVLATVCEPFIGLFRRILPTAVVGGAGIDFSPLAAILALSLLQMLVYAL